MSAVPHRPRPSSVRDDGRSQAAVSGSTARHATVHASAAVGGGVALQSDERVAAAKFRVSPGTMLNDTEPDASVRTSLASGGCDGIGARDAPGGGVGPGVRVGLGTDVDVEAGAVGAGAVEGAAVVGDAVGAGVAVGRGAGVAGPGEIGGTVVITVVPAGVAAVGVAAPVAVPRAAPGTVRSVSAHALTTAVARSSAN